MIKKFCALLVSMSLPFLLVAAEMEADQIHRDPYGMVLAEGNVHLTAKGLDIRAKKVVVDATTQTGELFNAEVTVDHKHRITSEHLKRIDLVRFYGENITYTICPDDAWAWSIVAGSATLNKEEGTFLAQNAYFEWGGIPVFYTPYWSHALTRRSGFLMPKFANSTRRGTQIDIPFYWSASPNWDMTVTPRWMSERGIMGDIEWRHRSNIGEEKLQIQSINDRGTGTQRGRLRTDMTWQFTPTIDAALDIDAVNDGLYISDFPLYGGDRESAAYLTSNTSMTWRDASDSAVFSSRYQQVLGGASNASTLQLLPRLQTRNYFNIGSRQSVKVDHQTTVFRRDIGVSGMRVGLRPSWSLPWQMAGGAVTANWSVLGQYVGYDSNNFTNTTSSYGALATSLEVGAMFEKIFAEKKWRHVIKPTVRFDVSSTEDQSALPRYDSSLLPLSFSNVLQGNRFSGWDRFERMRKVSVLLASSLQTKEKEVVRTVAEVQFGLVYDGLQESVDTAVKSVPTKAVSNLLAELSWMPTTEWRTSIGGQHDASSKRWVESHGSIKWLGSGQYVNVDWRKTDASYSLAAESLTLAGELQFNQRWSSHTFNQYDLLRKHVVQTRLGVAYAHACWNMSLEGFKTYQVGTNGLTDIGWRFLIAFEGLGSFGDG